MFFPRSQLWIAHVVWKFPRRSPNFRLHRVVFLADRCRFTRSRRSRPDVTRPNECADNIVVSAKCGATFPKECPEIERCPSDRCTSLAVTKKCTPRPPNTAPNVQCFLSTMDNNNKREKPVKEKRRWVFLSFNDDNSVRVVVLTYFRYGNAN